MAPWILPALKAVLPHVGTIVSAARPMFSKSSSSSADPLLQEQIAELQAAAAQNDAHIRELAQQLQSTVTAFQEAAAQAQAQSRQLTWLCRASLAVAVVALVMAAGALLAG